MTHLLKRWEGVSLSGDYTLEKWLGGDDSAAFFQTSLAPEGRRAVVKLMPEPVVDGAAQLDLWNRTRQLRHPNLVELLDFGRADHDGEIVLYAVFESPDDTLASALSRAPLDPQESREVLDAALSALRYLHAQGLVLGALDPDHIVAVGDRIKLSTGALREADASSAYREDVRLLGGLWQQVLLSASPRSPEIAAHAADANPETRWTLAEISAALEPPLPPAPPPAAPVVVVPTPIAPPAVAPPAITPSPLFEPPSYRHIPERTTSYGFLKWVLIAGAAGLLLLFGLNRPRPVASVSVPPATPIPAPPPPAKTAPPQPTVPEEPKPSPVGRSVGGPVAGKEMWRVIAFTYRTREAAAKKVQQLNEYHPGINAAVFSPQDKKGYYLVSLGGRMTHDEAVRLQRTARGKGLPRDLYVQNYTR